PQYLGSARAPAGRRSARAAAGRSRGRLRLRQRSTACRTVRRMTGVWVPKSQPGVGSRPYTLRRRFFGKTRTFFGSTMGRPRKPIEKHLLDGTFRADRHGPVPDDAGSGPAPVKPADLDDLAGAFWDRVVLLLAGIVRDRDGEQLAELCRW